MKRFITMFIFIIAIIIPRIAYAEKYEYNQNEKGYKMLSSTINNITSSIIKENEVDYNKMIEYGLLVIIITICIGVIIYRGKHKKQIVSYQKLFRNVFDNMNEGFALHEVIVDEKGNIIDYKFLEVNKIIGEFFGLKTEEIIGRRVTEVLPIIEKEWMELLKDVVINGENKTVIRYFESLGKYFNMSIYRTEPMQFVTIASEITEQVKAKEKVELERHLLEVILEDTLSGYWDIDFKNEKEYLSPSLKRMLGYEEDEIGNTRGTLIGLIHKEDLTKVFDTFNSHVASQGKVPYYNEMRFSHKDGSIVWIICSGRVIEWDEENKPLRMVGCHINITNLKNLEKELSYERNLFKTILNSLLDGVISTDKSGKVDLINPAAEKLIGWTNIEARGVEFEEVFNALDELTRIKCGNSIRKVLETGEIIELTDHAVLVKKDGSEIHIENSVAPIKDQKENINGLVIVFRDFTDRKEKQDKIMFLSYHDQLTGLYNRRFFEEELNRLDTERNLPFSIAMVDVNGLKLTNDAFGHKAGDELLKSVSEILKKDCRDDDIIARIGGDEFVILFPKTSNKETEKIVERIYNSIQNKKMGNIVISVSIGWETKNVNEQDMSEIFSKAEEYMYRKKLTESQSMRSKTLEVILRTLNEKNDREKNHSEKVSEVSKKIGEILNLDNETLKEIQIVGLMHDIGKIAIDDSILDKQRKLTTEEFEEVKRHSESGYHILKSVDAYNKLAEYVLSHHERWDGQGYPRGLSGEEIPLISRIIAIADAYEAMTGNRPYKKSKSKEEALNELILCSGTQFDPNIVKSFVNYTYNSELEK